jgi:hypothetical protein
MVNLLLINFNSKVRIKLPDDTLGVDLINILRTILRRYFGVKNYKAVFLDLKFFAAKYWQKMLMKLPL